MGTSGADPVSRAKIMADACMVTEGCCSLTGEKEQAEESVIVQANTIAHHFAVMVEAILHRRR